MYRLGLGLFSHPKEFGEDGVRTHVNSKEKIPSTGNTEEDQTYDAASSRTASPTHYQLSVKKTVTLACFKTFIYSFGSAWYDDRHH